ncbi:MAG: long-chain acyl-CoA synthetase, partial [Burkholderiaceae bacterium]
MNAAVPAIAAQIFPSLLIEHARQRPGHPAYREKALGIWQTASWSQVLAEVRALACGLAAKGFQRGQHLAIIGDNRPRLYWAIMATQCLGGVAVPLYQDAPAADMAYVLEDADIVFAIVEDQEQVDKLLDIKATLPLLTHIVFDDERGMRHYTQPELTAYQALQEQGREFDRAHPD